jgi:hypothetical protein
MFLAEILNEEAASCAISAGDFAGNRSVLFSGNSRNPIKMQQPHIPRLNVIKASKRKTVAGIPLITFTREPENEIFT